MTAFNNIGFFNNLISKQLICTFHVRLAEIVASTTSVYIEFCGKLTVDVVHIASKRYSNACSCSSLLFNDKRRFVIVYDVNKELFI